MSYWSLVNEAVFHDLLDGSTSGTVTGTEQYTAAEFGRQAFEFDGSTHITLDDVLELDGTNVTTFVRVKNASFGGVSRPLFGFRSGLDITSISYRDDISPKRWSIGRALTDNTARNTTLNEATATIDSTWRTVCWHAQTTAESVWQNIVAAGSQSGLAPAINWKLHTIGLVGSSQTPSGTAISDLLVLNRAPTETDRLEYDGGPEPQYVSGAFLIVRASSITGYVGEWNSHDNGDHSFEWKVLDEDLVEVASGTGANILETGLSNFPGAFSLHVRGTNLGSFDEGDGLDGLGGGNGYYKVAEYDATLGSANHTRLHAIELGV